MGTSIPPTSDDDAPDDEGGRFFDGAADAWRRMRANIGISARLVLGFSLLLILGVTASSLVFVNKSHHTISDILGEQARQISQTLAMAAERSYENGDREELRRLGRDLLKSRNIVLVTFYDEQGNALAMASRDPDLKPEALAPIRPGQSSVNLMQVHERSLPTIGNFLEISVPVLKIGRRPAAAAPPAAPQKTAPARSWLWSAGRGAASKDPSSNGGPPEARARLLGYLTVGVSQNHEQLQLRRVSAIGVGVGCLILIVLVPGVLYLVHRILKPIRSLADATHRIIGGDYDAHVPSDRRDEIGVLARSFNEMVRQVRQKQQELEHANDCLAEANRDLEEKVHQRTRELEATNKRLSSEIAEKEDFLRAVSHDLNAPLRNISGMAAMLLMKHRDKFDEDVVHRLQRIQKNVEVETGLIAELLELSRIKTRRQRLEPVDLDELVREVVDLFEDDLKQSGIEVNFDVKLPQLLCERSRLRQVFQNLIDNAIKYLGDGETRQIGVGCHVGRDEVEFYVRDTGVGIDAEDLNKVFYVFRRGKNSQTVKVAGKGVGLASVKSIVETYNGRIWVESEPGRGSTFRFTVHKKFVPMLGGRIEEETPGESGQSGLAA